MVEKLPDLMMMISYKAQYNDMAWILGNLWDKQSAHKVGIEIIAYGHTAYMTSLD